MRITGSLTGAVPQPKFASAQALERLGVHATAIILQRTARGVDADGAPFRAYSPGYAAFRADAGRQVDQVDLNFSGRMLGSLQHTVDVSSGAVTLFFPGEEAEKAYENQVRLGRRFFDLSEDDLRTLGAEMVREAVANA